MPVALWTLVPEQAEIFLSAYGYLITSRMLPDLIHNDHGTLTIHIQHQSPGKEKESNWLPAPDGEFYMIMRHYWPKPEALDGTWIVPPVEPVSKLEKTVQTPAGMIDAETITEAYIYLLGRALVIRQEHLAIWGQGLEYNVVHHNPLANVDFINPNMSVTNSH
jgi:Protein of unknown function (DUF1214)